MAPTPAPTVVWFRRDLRLADHPALRAAVDAGGPVVALFVHDPALLDRSGPNRVAYLNACLDSLDRSVGGALVERVGDPAEVVAAVAAEVGAEAVHVTEDFGPYGRRRDDRVEAALDADARVLRRTGTPYAVPPGTVRTKEGRPYKVFTPFSRGWRAQDRPEARPVPEGVEWATVRSDPRPATPEPDARAGLPPAGEEAAQADLAHFVEHHLVHYAERRDRPDLDATSRLSPHLKWGTVHPRQVLDAVAGHRGKGAETFVTELCWREFYGEVLAEHPDTATENLDHRMDGLTWDTGPEADRRFEAWTEGRTGYPIVDAGMRQLLEEGWMHNRVRMIVASFLVKDLHVHWRRGAAWFLHHLIDGDLASNSHGWQWVAGTGTDAAPFFRVFNPVSQGERFDPNGDYVRRYVPELRGVAGKAVHRPRADDQPTFDGYPPPIVDHAAERAEALRRFEAR